MRFSLQREVLLKPLAQVVNVVERRQTLPVLANLLVKVREGQLSLTGTDLEVEMVARTAVDDAQDGETTIPARKLFEIVRALPDGSKVTVTQQGDKITVQAGRSRFSLASLPANDFPSIDEFEATERVNVPEAGLKELIERNRISSKRILLLDLVLLLVFWRWSWHVEIGLTMSACTPTSEGARRSRG